MRMLPAAAIPEGSVISMEESPGFPGVKNVRITHIENSTPVPGRIMWTCEGDYEGVIYIEVGGAQRIEVVELPK
jgi:hypothetical protein